MQIFDTIIENGFVVDGTGGAGTYADVGIVGDTIIEVGNLKRREANKRIDASGRIVAPGHITQHTHYDAALFWDPYCLDAAHNGVTTVANANCGFGIAPVREKDRERLMGMLETTEQIPVAHQRAALPWNWESFPEYLENVRKLAKGVNVLTYLPLNPLLIYVMGIEAAKTRSPNAEEMSEIHRLINEAMDAGAIGISMSVMGAEGNSHLDIDGTCMPTDSMDHDAIVEICRALADRGEGIIQMLPQIVYYGDRSITERVAEMVKGTGVRVIHNTFLTHDMLEDIVSHDLDWLDAMRAGGCDITAGCMLNRGWVECGIRELDTAGGQLPAIREIVACNSDEQVLRLIDNSEFVQRFEQQYAEAGPSSGAAGLAGQTVIAVGDEPALKPFLGKTLAEVAEQMDMSVIAAMLDLGVRSRLDLQMKSPPISATSPEQALQYLSHAGVVGGGSDGGAHTKAFGLAHYATDLLIWLVREEKRMTLEDMHFQLSLKCAKSLKIRNRGALLPGFKADLLVYDLDKLHFDMSQYELVHDMPGGDWRRQARAGGYDYVLVNGQITHEQDKPTGATPGIFDRVTSVSSPLFAVAAE
ncbi:N-acyl-D-amino-acid deacylase family protein [Sphingorhabdus sp. 109]|jgi:N-acyl-D-aspartate/D-glutamate deacylase|uniref:N-acyl-D-amino-acid deacylase family protein n=1 Tax=Sphingorhabdus sp. 109 TaxID=2653173 RepID=UPI0012EEE61C|nr:amidohydrolase family protein [Sphingorhabdus sp. 109]VWX61081.1 Amidohydrolase [Sphingorhabdus sp. 109]